MAINLNLSASKGLRLAIGLSSLLIATLSVSDSSAQIAAAPSAHAMGAFGTPHNWPIMPIAMMLMPNGTVFAYGTDTGTDTGANAKQDTQQYAVWDTSIPPAWTRGSKTSAAFQLLPNDTKSNIFCSAQVHLLPNRALIIGGDVDILGVATNDGNNNVVVFESKNATTELPSITNREKMPWPRWYPTAVTLPNKTTLVLGGRMTAPEMNGDGPTDDELATYPPSTPYIRVPGMPATWKPLGTAGGADGNSAYGSLNNSWFYPRAWVDPRGKVFILTHAGEMFKLDTAGTGTLTPYAAPLQPIKPSSSRLSSVMFAPGKILSIRKDRVAIVVDITGTGEPVVTKIASLFKDRAYGSLTVLADGKVWANGGTFSPASNPKDPEQSRVELRDTNLDSEIWDPETNMWTATAKAQYARHYHSSALLLPDGSVMTAGGGSPGPETNLNGEIYYPPYLFNTNHAPAIRPTILSIVNGSNFSLTRIGWNRPMTITTGEGARNKINRITLVRAGAATHTFNNETRFFELTIPPLEVGTNVVTVSTPLNANEAPPGYYMVFMWNESGVPSVAKIIEIS